MDSQVQSSSHPEQDGSSQQTWSFSCFNTVSPLLPFLPTNNNAVPPFVVPVPPPTPASRSGRRRPRREQSVPSGEQIPPKKERNVWLARESRERKRLYVEGLEQEVVVLRAELAKKNARLARYELIERQLDIMGDEDRRVILSALEEMTRTKAAEPEFPSILIRKMKAITEERRKALEQLSHMMLEIAVPFSLRLFLWEAENGVEIFDPVHAEKVLGRKPTVEQMKLLATYAEYAVSCKDTYKELKARAVSAAQRIRKNVKQMVECQKAIQMETLSILRCLRKKVFPEYTKSDAELEIKFIPKLETLPELSNAAIFQLTEESLWQDANTEAYLDADEIENGVGEKICGDRGKDLKERKGECC